MRLRKPGSRSMIAVVEHFDGEERDQADHGADRAAGSVWPSMWSWS